MEGLEENMEEAVKETKQEEEGMIQTTCFYKNIVICIKSIVFNNFVHKK